MVELCVHYARADVLLRELAQRLSITERHAHGILNDLVEDGFLTKTKEGRRNRYEIQADIPVPEVTSRNFLSAASWNFWRRVKVSAFGVVQIVGIELEEHDNRVLHESEAARRTGGTLPL